MPPFSNPDWKLKGDGGGEEVRVKKFYDVREVYA